MLGSMRYARSTVKQMLGGTLSCVNASDVLVEQFGRLPDLVSMAVSGLTADQLTWAPAPGANTIGWLVWHLARVQDSHIAELLGEEEIWATGDWASRFGLPSGSADTGYGYTARQVAALRPESADALVDYFTDVHERTIAYLGGLSDKDLDRVVDENWDPPVTLGVRLVSVVDDDVQHVGQAAYVRGLLP
jgi:uncharacterized damage-inducible protein DinB